MIEESSLDSLQQALHQSVFLSAMSAQPGRDLPLCWEQHCKLLPGVAGLQASCVAHWTVDEVADFIHSLPGCDEQANQFKEEVRGHNIWSSSSLPVWSQLRVF
uniref:Lethal(3)malignant brain tumor-like protein 4 n=1 Tax=Salmo trutta TaxID=8032 RepID=A0A673YT91_SALTR